MKIFISSLLILIVIFAKAQSTSIYGNAKSYAGDELSFFTYTDLLTYNERTIITFKVAANGDFKCAISIKEITPTYINLGTSEGEIYLEPNKSYSIELPEKKTKELKDKLNPYYKENSFYIKILNADSTDLNHQIANFDKVFHQYLTSNFLEIYKNGRKSNVDTAIQVIDSVFSDTINSYFINYKKYKFALLKNIAYQRDINFVTRTYFLNQPILYNNASYMDFFNQVYTKYFNYFKQSKEGNTIFSDIAYEKSFKILKQTLSKNYTLSKNESLQELIILKGLYDAFYSEDYPKKPILQILDSIIVQSAIPTHVEMAKNIKKNVTKMLCGYPAPAFELFDNYKNKTTIADYKNKYVYINFSSTLSYSCKEELMLFNDLYKKYGKNIEFVTIACDENFKDAQNYFKKNNYEWTLLDFSNQPEIITNYNVKAYPTYYLINPEGKLVLSPAPSPKENIDFYFAKLTNPGRKESDIDELFKLLNEK